MVPYRNQREGYWQWVDLWNCLYRDRIIFLYQAIDEELGNQLVATMLYLDSENKKDISLYINGTGGEVVPMLALHDTMRHVKSDVSTVGFGGCMGMMGFLLAMGQKGKVTKHNSSRVALAGPSQCCVRLCARYQPAALLDPAALLSPEHARDAPPPVGGGAGPGVGHPPGVARAAAAAGLHHGAPGHADGQRLREDQVRHLPQPLHVGGGREGLRGH